MESISEGHRMVGSVITVSTISLLGDYTCYYHLCTFSIAKYLYQCSPFLKEWDPPTASESPLATLWAAVKLPSVYMTV